MVPPEHCNFPWITEQLNASKTFSLPIATCDREGARPKPGSKGMSPSSLSRPVLRSASRSWDIDRGEAEVGTDVRCNDLGHGALAATVLGAPRALGQLAGDQKPLALAEAPGDVLGQGVPGDGGEEPSVTSCQLPLCRSRCDTATVTLQTALPDCV